MEALLALRDLAGTARSSPSSTPGRTSSTSRCSSRSRSGSISPSSTRSSPRCPTSGRPSSRGPLARPPRGRPRGPRGRKLAPTTTSWSASAGASPRLSRGDQLPGHAPPARRGAAARPRSQPRRRPDRVRRAAGGHLGPAPIRACADDRAPRPRAQLPRPGDRDRDPEPGPLAVFGPVASEAVAEMLKARGSSSRPARGSTRRTASWSSARATGGSSRAEVVALTTMDRPGMEGLPTDPDRFIRIDDRCRVHGLDDVYAAETARTSR